MRWGQKQARVGNGQKKMPGALTLPLRVPSFRRMDCTNELQVDAHGHPRRTCCPSAAYPMPVYCPRVEGGQRWQISIPDVMATGSGEGAPSCCVRAVQGPQHVNIAHTRQPCTGTDTQSNGDGVPDPLSSTLCNVTAPVGRGGGGGGQSFPSGRGGGGGGAVGGDPPAQETLSCLRRQRRRTNFMA